MSVSNQLLYHESAHAVMAWRVGVALAELQVVTHPLQKLVSTKNHALLGASGFTEFKKPFDWRRSCGRVSKRQALKRIAIAVAGPLIEARWYYKVDVSHVLCTTGWNDKVTIEYAAARARITTDYLTEFYEIVYSQLSSRRTLCALEEVASRLSKKFKLDGVEVHNICRSAIGSPPPLDGWKLWPLRPISPYVRTV